MTEEKEKKKLWSFPVPGVGFIRAELDGHVRCFSKSRATRLDLRRFSLDSQSGTASKEFHLLHLANHMVLYGAVFLFQVGFMDHTRQLVTEDGRGLGTRVERRRNRSDGRYQDHQGWEIGMEH